MKEPWGTKFTIVAYMAGEPTQVELTAFLDAINGVAIDPKWVFVGAAMEDVQDEPYDQGADKGDRLGRVRANRG